jgi:hypothetical protein
MRMNENKPAIVSPSRRRRLSGFGDFLGHLLRYGAGAIVLSVFAECYRR